MLMKSTGRSQIIPGDLFKWFITASPTQRANLIFLDPPYRFLKEHPENLRRLGESLATNHLAKDALLIFRHDAEDQLELPPLKSIDRREYGGMSIELLTRG